MIINSDYIEITRKIEKDSLLLKAAILKEKEIIMGFVPITNYGDIVYDIVDK